MFRGIFPVIPTLFSDTDDVDFDSTCDVVRFAIGSGAHGIVFPGVASEVAFLTSDERGRLMEVIVDEVNGRVPIIGGASAATADEVIVTGERARACGIKTLMVMAPASMGDDFDSQQQFFATIASQLDDVEVIVQNAPSPIGAGLSSKAIAMLIKGNRSLTYAKEETLPSGPAITAIDNCDASHLKGVFGGGGARYLIDELNRGAIGAIPAVELTRLHVAIYDAHSAGQHQLARQLYRLSLPLLAAQMIYRMRLTKYVLKGLGVANRLHVRAPLPELDEFARRDIDNMLSDLRDLFPGIDP